MTQIVGNAGAVGDHSHGAYAREGEGQAQPNETPAEATVNDATDDVRLIIDKFRKRDEKIRVTRVPANGIASPTPRSIDGLAPSSGGCRGQACSRSARRRTTRPGR